MKKILLLALLFVSIFANAQNIKNDGEPYEVYCAFHGELLLSGRFKPKSFVWGEELHKKIKRNVGMPVSIGLAPNKTLAKMASHFAKK